MKKRLWLLTLPLLVLMGMLLTLNNAMQPTQVSADKAHPINMTGGTEEELVPQTTPTCTTHTTAMTLTTSPAAPEVGDELWVTVTLANEGCGLVGLPLYRLTLMQRPYMLVLDSPISVTHYLGLESGETDTVTFSLQAIGVGTATLRAYASFEVHLGYPGPAYWGYDATAPVSVNVPVTDTEVVVLQQAAYELGYFPKIRQEGNTYTFGYAVAAGHSVDGRIERFVDRETAQTEFAYRQGTLPLVPFYCYPAYIREYKQATIPRRQAWHSWLAERWIMTAHRWDDTEIPAPVPVWLSEAIYRAAIRNHLFLACVQLYLPVVCKQ